MQHSRKDADMARTIDAALIVRKLRGTEEAIDYLRAAHACEELIARVLSPGSSRASMTAVPYQLPAAGDEPRSMDMNDEASGTGVPGARWCTRCESPTSRHSTSSPSRRVPAAASAT